MLLTVTYVTHYYRVEHIVAFPWQHLIVSRFVVEVKQIGSTGKCVEESKDRDSPRCCFTLTSPDTDYVYCMV
jgi:hypothetical protein